MLPVINEDILQIVAKEIMRDVSSWRKSMIHYIKDENPEVNSAIIEIANNTDLDPKAVATGAYMVYKMLEMSSCEQDSQDIVE